MKVSIYELVGSALSSFVCLYLLMILMKEKNILSNKRFWISVLIVSFYVYISFLLTNSFIKVIFQIILITILCSYSTKNKKSIFSVFIAIFFIYAALFLIEIILSTILIGLMHINNQSLNAHVIIKFIFNGLSIGITVLIFSSVKIRNFIFTVSQYNISYAKRYIFIILSLSICLFSVSIYFCLFNYNVLLILIVLFLMIAVYTIVVITMIRAFEQRSKIQVEYDILLTNLSEYENLLDKQRISNHENKNQLLVIKGMVDKNESNVSEYINSIIDTQYKDNDTLIIKTNRIPSGGLKGLIYYKMLTMKEKKINVNLEVDRSLRDLDFSTIPVKTHQELCKIVGVLLDNAIQALENSTNKEINIFLEYVDNEFIIKISNTYDGNIDLDKIDSAGYTTKGKGHGYGLSLVKNIIRDNKVFKNERELNGKLFSQIIKLNIQ